MFQAADIVEGAKSIRPHLPVLLNEGAAELDEQLSDLLNSERDEEETALQVLGLLSEVPKAAEWLSDFLAVKSSSGEVGSHLATRSFNPVPGQHAPPKTDKYICPRGDFIWYRIAVGTTVPTCRTHPDMPLIKIG